MKAADGKILRVNLSTLKTSLESSAKYAERFLGGRGVNQWILFNELPLNTSPLSADNMMVFGTGPLAGTLAPGACRLSIDSKNTLTNGIGSSSCGGGFAPELRFAGYNNIVIEGKSEAPVYLFIDDHKAEIKEASHIWGRTTWETDAMIKEEIGDNNIQMVYIGPAGENLVKGACIITDLEKAAGRCGLGAVMGSKRLKAIAVRGTGSIEVADPKKFMRAVDEVREKLRVSDILKKRQEYGIYHSVLWGENFRESPWRNFQGGYIPNHKQIAEIHPDVFRNKFKKKSMSCFSCPIHCRALLEVRDGPYAGLLSEGLENNDIQLFGAKLNIFDPAAILKLRSLCNQYGLDTDNATGAIAWAFECYQRGIINEEITDGLKLEWGSHETCLELIRKITYREGFGNILAEGSKKASEIIGRGSKKYAIHLKGQDLMEHLWVDKGWALGTVLSPRGGTHTRGAVMSHRYAGLSSELSKRYFQVEKIGAPTEYEGKAKLVTVFEKLEALADSLGLCTFVTIIWTPPPGGMNQEGMAELLSASTGLNIDSKEMMNFGDRIHNLEKAFNVLHTKWTRKDDFPPRRFVEEPVKIAGPFRGECLHLDKWDRVLDEYYALHGWDEKTSWPTRETLEKLDLRDIADILEKAEKLP
ncbi:MAG: aldehyde ferredoxin oxidoreductase family protein [Candidatus Hodarchaeota archaeon]